MVVVGAVPVLALVDPCPRPASDITFVLNIHNLFVFARKPSIVYTRCVKVDNQSIHFHSLQSRRKGCENMFKVLATVHHGNSTIEHLERFYTDRADAVNYMEVLSFVLDTMQNDGRVVSYDIQLISGCKEDE